MCIETFIGIKIRIKLEFMKINLLVLLLCLFQSIVFAQDKSEREIYETVVVKGNGRTMDEAKYNAILSALNQLEKHIASSYCFDNNEESLALMETTIVDDFKIIEEQILSENNFILTLNIVFSFNCAYLAYRPSFQEQRTHLIFKKKEQAIQYLNYLVNNCK